MKYKEIRKTPRYRSERAADGLAITRSAFQLLLGVILLMFILSVIFIALLPIVTFQKKSGDRLQYYSVVTVRSDDFHKGDIVSLKTDQHITAGEILALEHEKIVIGNDKTQSVNCVQYQDKRYFTYEELSSVLKDAEVPEGYVLLNGDLNSSEELSVGELVSEDYITGKVSMVLYPFSTFGRSADYLK